MLLPSNKVADEGASAHPTQEGQAMVDSLMKVVACYRYLASCIGGCADSTSLRQELRQTRERTQTMVQSCRDHLTARLRDRCLPDQERREAELQWVAFSSCLELFHADMCKVYHMGNTFSVANYSYMVWTGGTSEIAARALSLPELQEDAGEEDLEQTQLEEDIAHVDRTLQDMEQKVNVLHWTVEAQGPLYAEPLSSDSTSSALLSVDEEAPGGLCNHAHLSAVLLLCGVAAMAVALSVSVALLA